MTDYASFIEDVKQNYQSYDQEKWKQQDKEFEKYSKELYQQFSTKLSPTEQARLIRFDFVYSLVRGNINLSDLISGKYNQALTGYVSELTSVLNEATLTEQVNTADQSSKQLTLCWTKSKRQIFGRTEELPITRGLR